MKAKYLTSLELAVDFLRHFGDHSVKIRNLNRQKKKKKNVAPILSIQYNRKEIPKNKLSSIFLRRFLMEYK